MITVEHMMRLNFDFGKNGGFYYESADMQEGLVGTYNAIGDLPFGLLGVDAKKIRGEVASLSAKDMGGAVAQIKVGKLVKSANGGEYTHLCEALIVDELVKKYLGEVVPKKNAATAAAKMKGKLVFMSDLKDWVIVKKTSLTPESTPREAAAFLLGVKTAVLSKYLSLKFPTRAADTDAMLKALKGKRKGLATLKDVYDVSGKDVCAFLAGAALLGYSLTPGQNVIKKAFPELKLPGMRGRKRKK